MRKIIQLLLICFLMSITIIVFAQEDTTQKPFPFLRHEVSFSIGDPIVYNMGLLSWYPINYSNGHLSWYTKSFQDWFSNDEYIKQGFITPIFSVSYFYRIIKWLWVGGSISYTNNHYKVHDIVTDQYLRTENESMISILPCVRFSWLNKPYITLYSGISVGYLYTLSNSTDNRRAISYHHLAAQCTFIGISGGKKWFGFAELGYGHKGIVSAGFGYRFNNKSK